MYMLQELTDKIVPVLQQYPIKRAAVFGSYARGEQKHDSDLDLILELDLTNELPDIIYVIWDELENIIKLKTDIVTFKALNTLPDAVQARILNDLRYFYEI